jgi:hypothetical protein
MGAHRTEKSEQSVANPSLIDGCVGGGGTAVDEASDDSVVVVGQSAGIPRRHITSRTSSHPSSPAVSSSHLFDALWHARAVPGDAPLT